MKYCTKCGAELLDDAVVCPNCGCKANNNKTKYCTHCGAPVDENASVCIKCGCAVENNQDNSDRNTLGMIAKVFMIISCVVMGISTFGIALAWCIPMTLAVSRRLERREPIGIALKVCTLIFVNTISGILLLCMNDENRQNY